MGDTRKVEASMHAPYEKSPKSDQGTFSRIGVGLLVLPAFAAVVLVALAIMQPKASTWISEAVQAEFSGVAGDMPKELAGPSMQVRTVRAY